MSTGQIDTSDSARILDALDINPFSLVGVEKRIDEWCDFVDREREKRMTRVLPNGQRVHLFQAVDEEYDDPNNPFGTTTEEWFTTRLFRPTDGGEKIVLKTVPSWDVSVVDAETFVERLESGRYELRTADGVPVHRYPNEPATTFPNEYERLFGDES